MDGQDNKNAASQLRTARWRGKPEGQMRDEAASGIIEEDRGGGGGFFYTRVCHIDPRYRQHPISNSKIKPPTKQTVKIKVMESVPLSI